jgi:hypothetical protein
MINSILSKTVRTEVVSNATELAWWTKIYTKAPFCIYYFGPFDRVEEANDSKFGYIEDLENEGAEVVFIKYLVTDHRKSGSNSWLINMG